MFSPASVCWFVSRHSQKLLNGFPKKYGQWMCLSPEWLVFGADLDNSLDQAYLCGWHLSE